METKNIQDMTLIEKRKTIEEHRIENQYAYINDTIDYLKSTANRKDAGLIDNMKNQINKLMEQMQELDKHYNTINTISKLINKEVL